MSDGVSDVDITIRQLLELKKTTTSTKELTEACLRLCSLTVCKEKFKRCVTFLSRIVADAEVKLKAIRRRTNKSDELFFLNSYSGFAPYLRLSLSLTPLPLPTPITPLNPTPSLSTSPSTSKGTVVSCEKCEVKSREIRNISRRLATAHKQLISRKPYSKRKFTSITKRLTEKTVSNRKLWRANGKLREKVTRLSEKNSAFEQRLRFLENENEEAQDNLAAVQPGIVRLFDGGSFTPDTVSTVIEMMDCGVADERVGRVIESVGRLVGVEVDRVPSPSTVRNFALASLTVAKMHVSERFAKAIREGESICLLSDETNKKGNKYQLFGTGLAKGDGGQEVMVFGLSQVADKSAQTAFDVLKQRLDSLGGLGRGSEIDQFTDRFLAATTCTMSDRASTQLRLNTMLTDYRAKILPKITSGWDSMSSEDQKRALEFHSFYCQLHVIANLTNVVLEILSEHERLVTGKEVAALSPTAFTVVKEVARLFGERSAGMHGCSMEFKAWMGKNLAHSSFPSFLGHRFNVVFLLGARVFCQKENLKKFIDECGGSKPELVRLRELLDLPLVSEHLQILGLVDQLVTGPLWRIVESLNHVLETRSHASLLLSWVGHCKGDPMAFFSGVSPVPSLQTIAAGTEEMLGKLLSVTPSESSLEATVLLMESMERYFKHLFVDFIEGGRYSGVVSEDVVERTRCALGHNRHIESSFGFVDRLHSHSPNMRVPRRNAMLMISKNHSNIWLSSKSAEERRAIISIARSSLAGLKADHIESEKRLAAVILEKAHEREKDRVVKKACVVVKRMKAVEGVASSGIVTHSAAISSLLDNLSAPARMKALIAQIRFRERALKQEPPEERIYVLSHKGSPLSETELRRRLEVLIDDDLKGLHVTRSLPNPLIGCSIRRWVADVAEDGRVLSVEKRGPFTMISVEFPSGIRSFPLGRFESELEDGEFELLDEIL